MGNFGIADLEKVLRSQRYQQDLEDLSSYAANIKQERPIVWLLAKHLNQQDFVVALEKKKVDLTVNDTRIEAKFYYESDLVNGLERELVHAGRGLDVLLKSLEELKEQRKGTGWSMSLAILKDMVEKAPDIFILVILSRNLLEIDNSDLLDRICWSKYELPYNQTHRINCPASLKLADDFLDRVRQERPFLVRHVRLNTQKDFHSTYHFYLCDFKAQSGQQARDHGTA